MLFTSAKSGPPMVKDTVSCLPMDWSLLSRKGITKQQLQCPKA